MTVAVTGASGFVGSAVVRALLAQRREVLALHAPGESARGLDGLDVDRVACDATDEATLRKAFDGCEAVYHLAAVYKLWTPDPEPLFRVNVEGTTAVMLACAAAKVKRIVHTSSIMAVGLADGEANEETSFNLHAIAGTYTLTKHLSERIAMRFAASGLPIVIVNPSLPFGPGDTAPTPTGQIILNVIREKVPVLGPGGFSCIDVDDCAAGHLLAEEKGKIGERYILTNHNVLLADFIPMVARIADVRSPSVRVPRALGLAMARAIESWSENVSHREPLVTYNEAAFASRNAFFSNAKARRDLGLPTRPLEETIRRAIDDLRQRDTGR